MEEDLICFSHPTDSHRLVLLHGWGADAEDLCPIGQYLSEINGLKLEIVSLRAPQVHISGIGRQWYPLFPADWDSAKKAVSELKLRLKKLETRAIPLSKTIILGFSQGGAMTIAAGCEMQLAAIVACSAYAHPNLLLSVDIPPILICHGEHDEVVPKNASDNLMELFTVNGIRITREIFSGAHEIPQEILPKIKLFLEDFIL